MLNKKRTGFRNWSRKPSGQYEKQVKYEDYPIIVSNLLIRSYPFRVSYNINQYQHRTQHEAEVWGGGKTEGTIPEKFCLWVLHFSNEGILINTNTSIFKMYFVFNGGLFCLALNFLCIVKTAWEPESKPDQCGILKEREIGHPHLVVQTKQHIKGKWVNRWIDFRLRKEYYDYVVWPLANRSTWWKFSLYQ